MGETDEMIYNRYLSEHNEDDFRILLERHRESLTLFLMGYVHNEEDAEELMIDAYAEVAADGGYLGKSSFKTWLFSIGKNLALMKVRKRRFGFIFMDSEIEESDVLEQNNPEMEILKEERNQQLIKALDCINEDYRQILILIYFEEMSVEDAAKVMRMNRKKIYNLTERGKKALKAELERQGFSYAQYE